MATSRLGSFDRPIQIESWKPRPSEGGKFQLKKLDDAEKWMNRTAQIESRSWFRSFWKWLLPFLFVGSIWNDSRINELFVQTKMLPVDAKKLSHAVEIAFTLGSEQATNDLTSEKPEAHLQPQKETASEVQRASLVIEPHRTGHGGARPPFLPPIRRTAKEMANARWFARTSSVLKMREWASGMREDVRFQTVEALREGLGAKQLAARLEARWDHYGQDFGMIAVTELNFAFNAGMLLTLPAGSYVTVPPINDDRVCGHCKELLENKIFEVLHAAPENPTRMELETCVWPGKSNYGRKVKDYVPCVPLHPNCRHMYVYFSGVPIKE